MSDLPPIVDAQAVARTRDAWHMVAEHVLAPARYRATGRIGLHIGDGGFGTPPYDHDGVTEAVHVAGNEIRVARGDATVAHPLTTVGDAARAVGIEPGAPANVYPPTTPLDPDAPLGIDLDAGHVLSTWFELGWSVLEELGQQADESAAPSALTLWPEHFDAAMELGNEAMGQRGTFGVSPGDADHPEPYVYVTHWADVPDDAFWNDTAFPGASLPYAAVVTAKNAHDTVLDFFRTGLARLSGASA